MKTTYIESFFLKVSKYELPIDGVSLGMNYALRRDKLSNVDQNMYFPSSQNKLYSNSYQKMA